MIEPAAVSGGSGEQLFEAFLNQHDDRSWRQIVLSLLSSIHSIDKTATQIWFSFFPLSLAKALKQSNDPERLARRLSLDGRYLLKDQIDSAHQFLYGHRYWPQVKAAVSELAASGKAPASLDLATQIQSIATNVAKRMNIDSSLVTGITAVAFMTLQQVGANALKTSPGSVGKLHKKTPDQIVRDREHDDTQHLFKSFFYPDKIFSIFFDELDQSARFKLINTQHLTTAAANDKRNYHSRDPRCVVGEGPIPVECRSASCGTCWVGVLAGSQKLSEVRELERRKISEFGYVDTDDPRPLIRLACQAQAYGNVTIVIPRWNGVYGRILRAEQHGLENEL